MDYQIKGDDFPVLQVRLQAGESMYTESGGMAWMTDGIDMKTSGKRRYRQNAGTRPIW